MKKISQLASNYPRTALQASYPLFLLEITMLQLPALVTVALTILEGVYWLILTIGLIFFFLCVFVFVLDPRRQLQTAQLPPLRFFQIRIPGTDIYIDMPILYGLFPLPLATSDVHRFAQ